MSKPTIACYIRMPDGTVHNIDSFSEEEKREIGRKLHKQSMQALGMVPVDHEKSE